MKIIEEYLVTDAEAGSNLLDFVNRYFQLLPSKSACKKAFHRGEVLVNGKPSLSNYLLQGSETVSLIASVQTPPRTFELELDVLFEDDYLAIVYKPAGIAVSGNMYKTIVNALSYNLDPSTLPDALLWPKTAHRLDVPTQGLLIAAKTAKALFVLGRMFQERKIQKRYSAIVTGKLMPSGVFDQPIDELEAETRYQTIKTIPSVKVGKLSLVNLYPSTGRKHQLRRHLAEAGHPIVGDKTYTSGPAPLLKGKGLFLAALELEFQHPALDTTVHITADLPDKFKSLLKREEARWKKYHG